MAYCGERITIFDNPTPGAAIKTLIEEAMPQLYPIAPNGNPAWSIAWGPAVYTIPGAILQDHMMYAVRNNDDPNQIVVAIRGTNGMSEVDWLLGDLAVEQMVPWPPGAVSEGIGGAISESTSIDLQRLLAMTSSLDGVSSLLEFLTNAISGTSGTSFVTVTGHSKGGVMSSTMALYLKQVQQTWDPAGAAVVSNVSFAGPTAGDAAFAAYSDSQFASPSVSPPGWDASLGSNMDACRNSLDVATLAWTATNFDKIVTIYSPTIKMGWGWSFVKDGAQSGLMAVLGKQDFTQVELSQAPMTGALSGEHKTGFFTGLEASLKAFAAEGGFQHHAYPAMLGVPKAGDPAVIKLT
ncbi:MAG: hypothetical protein AAF515_01565 [Pseudomonadota bacterium]